MLTETLEFLRGLDGVEPAQARERLDDLRARFPDVVFRLLWQREEYDGSLHYDLLARTPDGETVSLSRTAGQELPWPLRGLHRVSENVLCRVDGMDVRVDQAVALLDFLWQERPLMDRIVESALLRGLLEEQPAELDATALQAAMDAFRRARGLLTPEATEAWMAERGLSHEALEEIVAEQAALARLRARVPGLEEHLRERRRTAKVEWFWGPA
ncbi:TIGR04500 family putative peptide maturation system protein [Microbispora sp. NPDC046933]|uniref:TIGR04500 family putative peptide maturation system protein n=1 Tax=Microbispora sp. NPDC046933 TaxID=3155618 RepID=UPI0033E0A575